MFLKRHERWGERELQRPNRVWEGVAPRLLAFLVGLLLLSWPFGSEPVRHTPGFLLVYLFVVWLGLIVVLWLLARAASRSSPPPGEED